MMENWEEKLSCWGVEVVDHDGNYDSTETLDVGSGNFLKYGFI